MFDRHQAEITVMQFTLFRCISLWVYHGEFFSSSHFVCQFPPTRFPLITAVRMCHPLPVHHLGMVFLAGSKAKIHFYTGESTIAAMRAFLRHFIKFQNDVLDRNNIKIVLVLLLLLNKHSVTVIVADNGIGEPNSNSWLVTLLFT